MNGLTSSESVVIVVVPRDRFSMFPRCLEALYAYTDAPFRVVVVSGGTDRTTEEYLHQFQAQKGNMSVILTDRLLMQGDARNVGLRQADERFCVLLENDTIVHENWLAPMLECMREEEAAVVTPLVLWYRGIHAAGCVFDEQEKNGAVAFDHKIIYTEISRKRIDYPECHCVLIDRQLLSFINVFDDVGPFDVDLGLTLRKYGLSVFLEPRSIVTCVKLRRRKTQDGVKLRREKPTMRLMSPLLLPRKSRMCPTESNSGQFPVQIGYQLC